MLNASTLHMLLPVALKQDEAQKQHAAESSGDDADAAGAIYDAVPADERPLIVPDDDG